MNDLESMFAAISEEADTMILNRPNDIRGRADRRTRIQVAALSAAIVLAVIGTASSARLVLKADERLANPAVSQDANPIPIPSPAKSVPASTAASAPATIPDSAFLRAADVHAIKAPYSVPSADMLPSLCGASYPIDSTVKARQTVHIIADISESGQLPYPESFNQTITTYDGDGAATFVAQLRAAVTSCPTEVRDGFTNHISLLSGTAHGHESLLFEVRIPSRDVEGNPSGREYSRLTSVVRIGPVVMILNDAGWEDGTAAGQVVVDKFTQTAVARVNAWLG